MEKMDNSQAIEMEVIEDMQKSMSHLDTYSGFEWYQEWRNSVFSFFRNLILTNNIERAQAISNVALMIESDLDIFFKAGFIHDGYKDNLNLSVFAFFSNIDKPEQALELVAVIDKYVKPPTKATQDFKNSFYKGMSGLFAYLLSKQEGCSENLALWISKQVFGYGSEQTVFDALKSIKEYLREGGCIPLSAKLALFYVLFYEIKPDWSLIKPRSIHTASKNDLAKGMEAIKNIRKELIEHELAAAQKSLIDYPERFDGVITPEFIDRILNFSAQEYKIDDELTLAVLWAGFFGDSHFSFFLPAT